MTGYRVWRAYLSNGRRGVFHASRQCPAIVNIGDNRIYETVWWSLDLICNKCVRLLAPAQTETTAELRQTSVVKLREIERELQQ